LYGLEPGLVRTYENRLPVCGNAHVHLMEKRVEKELGLAGGKAVLVDVRLSQFLELHSFPSHFREVFTETDEGFGFYELKPEENPDAAESDRIDIELPKPITPGTRKKYQGGEIVVEAIEDVVVRAGKFVGCARVRFQFDDDANLFWFAPGVGMVRGFSESKDKDGRPKMEYELIQLSQSPGH
jgi:hypothetical protein